MRTINDYEVEYIVRALEGLQMSINAQTMVRAHATAPNRAMSRLELARTIGSDNPNSCNSSLGVFARNLALALDPSLQEVWRPAGKRQGDWVMFINAGLYQRTASSSADPDEWVFVMRENLARALAERGFASFTPLDDNITKALSKTDAVDEHEESAFEAGSHFVAYHSVERMGHDFDSSTQHIAFTSSKSDALLRKTIGNTVWMIVGEPGGRPKQYSLAGAFYPSRLKREKGASLIVGPGDLLMPRPMLNNLPWFTELRKSQANFSLGINPISVASAVEGLRELLSGTGTTHRLPAETQSDEDALNELFSDREVEKAAIAFVTRHYEQLGWKVCSVEKDGIGYDLDCIRMTETLHVEVKGSRKAGSVIILTAKEWARARSDNQFRLATVAQACSENPQLRIEEGREVRAAYDVQPIAYRAKRLNPKP